MSLARVSITFDEDVLAAVIEELGLKNPPSFTLNGSERVSKNGNTGGFQRIRGLYHHDLNHVTIATQGGESWAKEGLYILTKHLRFTVLHELRHAYQREHWTPQQLAEACEGPYALQGVELDANAWAEYASPLYKGLIIVRRQTIGKSGFARMNDRSRRQPA